MSNNMILRVEQGNSMSRLHAALLAGALAWLPHPAFAQAPLDGEVPGDDHTAIAPCRTSHAIGQYLGYVAPPVQDYEPSPALWKLADADTTIYIFGTFHVLPEGFRWRTPLLDKVIDDADEVVFESREDDPKEAPDGEPVASAEELRFMQLFADYRSETPLSERIDPANRGKLARMLELAGLASEQIEYAPPMITMFAIGLAMSEAEGSQRSLGVETVIEAEFKANGRPISAIEDPVAVLEALLAIDETQIVAMLDEGLAEWDGCTLIDPGETDWSAEHQWAQGKLDGLELAEWAEDPFSAALYDVLLKDRNLAWIDWLEARMTQPGKILLAVGAGHMEGPDSVIALLAARGWSVERLQ